MDGMGSEVNNKMRSAVKAKLIELGSGTAGYIDDELPDYVMIMVANKRSKEQMVGDLSLFLGKNTDTFVSWLHQVLEKLQEVTLPATAPVKAKHKTSESTTDKRNDKTKAKPKKRGTKEKTPENTLERSTTPPLQSATTSITDVFADHLIQKAKKVIEPPLNVKKAEKMTGATNDGFDIPTISEIAKKAVGAVVCRKEITELAELQKKIDQAKRQLRHMTDESEDEDFLNLGADKIDFDAELSNNSKDTTIAAGVVSNSSVYEQQSTVAEPSEFSSTVKTHQKITFEERVSHHERDLPKKQSVLDRLGNRNRNETDAEKSDKTERGKNIISLSAHRRMEQAIYVPAHRRTSELATKPPTTSRRTDNERARERSPIRGSDYRRSSRTNDSNSRREISRSRDEAKESREPRDLREKVNKQRNRDIELRSTRGREARETNRSEEKPSITNRIVSRVIVAPAKPEQNDDEEEPIEVPVSSVVKVKPRPLIPRSKQASKNLLLRAVAEAQKSTALVKTPREFPSTDRGPKELYTKSFRKKLQKDNIVVEIATDDMDDVNIDAILADADADADADAEELEIDEEEYVPQAIQTLIDEDSQLDDDPFIYVPQSIHNNGLKDTDGPKTQFVVTLDSLGFPTKKPTVQNSSIGELTRNKPAYKSDERKKTPIINRIGKRPQDNENGPERKSVEDNRNKSPPNLKRKRTPIKFDINDEKESKDEVEPEKKRRSKSSDRKSATESERDRRSTDRKSTDRKITDRDDNRKRDSRSKERESGENNTKIRTLKTSSQTKYDNLPPLSSAITVTSEIKLTKKERCKFYPVCTRGDRCDYYHPTTPCKAFPNCKYGDVCLYIHPKCKFDLTCSRLDCNFTHTPVASAAPPLASHVVPVSNYKKIVTTPLPTLCRFYPNCSNTLCEFYHPKPCKFGKSCTNKVECNFYHFDLPAPPPSSASMPMKNKLKWVASAV